MQVLGTGVCPFLYTEDAHTVPQASSIINIETTGIFCMKSSCVAYLRGALTT